MVINRTRCSGGGQGARHNNAHVAITSNKTTPAGWNSYGNSGGVSANGNYSGGGGGGAGILDKPIW